MKRQSPIRRLTALLDGFSSVQVLVIGDLMLDRYIWGRVDRISPEAPVPVVRVTRESLHAGGAANAAVNVRALGGKVVVCGIVGRDQAGRQLLQELNAGSTDTTGVIISNATSTISKTRIIAHSQQVVRLDHEQSYVLNRRAQSRIQTFLRNQIGAFDVVVISDYGKGVIDAELLALLADLRTIHGFFYLIDPKKRNFAHYRGASLIKPNTEEAAAATGLDICDDRTLHQAGVRLLELWQSESVLVSRGEEGMSLFKPKTPVAHFPTVAREVFDVTGAGDTVLATCALALGAGASPEEATILANHAAGVVVGKVGTATISLTELHAALQGGKR